MNRQLRGREMDKGMEGKGKVMDEVCWRDHGKDEGSDFSVGRG